MSTWRDTDRVHLMGGPLNRQWGHTYGELRDAGYFTPQPDGRYYGELDRFASEPEDETQQHGNAAWMEFAE